VKLRIYLDTSVFSALFDERNVERRDETRRFWDRRSEFELGTSELAKTELQHTPSPSLRKDLLALLESVDVSPLSHEMEDLASCYVRAGVFTPVMLDDARHVAAAVIGRFDVLLSWNFRHLVNRRRRAMVNEVNAVAGVRSIEILVPPEL
jgi:predicted nucleic acid-binding protein